MVNKMRALTVRNLTGPRQVVHFAEPDMKDSEQEPGGLFIFGSGHLSESDARELTARLVERYAANEFDDTEKAVEVVLHLLRNPGGPATEIPTPEPTPWAPGTPLVVVNDHGDATYRFPRGTAVTVVRQGAVRDVYVVRDASGAVAGVHQNDVAPSLPEPAPVALKPGDWVRITEYQPWGALLSPGDTTEIVRVRPAGEHEDEAYVTTRCGWHVPVSAVEKV